MISQRITETTQPYGPMDLKTYTVPSFNFNKDIHIKLPLARPGFVVHFCAYKLKLGMCMFQILQSNANILSGTQHSPTNWSQNLLLSIKMSCILYRIYFDIILGIMTNSRHKSSLESEDCLAFISFIQTLSLASQLIIGFISLDW